MATTRDEGPTGVEGTQPIRILVVDDEQAVRRFLSIVLERMGYQVESAAGGVEAIQIARERSFDVVLTDLVMPRVDGIQVIEEIKKISPTTEVVIITGYPSSETIVAATRAGAVDYLPKSADPQHLEALIGKVLQIRDLRRKAGERDYFVRMAQMDGLTELFNNSAFHGFLDREAARSVRSGRAMSLLLADFDSLADINVQYGPLYGDRVVRRVAKVVRASCRAYDVVARVDTARFGILAPETDAAGGLILGRRISAAVAGSQGAGEEAEMPLWVNVGVAGLPSDAGDVESLVARADEALLAAKRQGPGTVGVP